MAAGPPIQALGSRIRVYLPVLSTIDAAVRLIEDGTRVR